ncbi:MAG: 50S ribosome-binding GTPase [Phycisphaerales bacterium]|nr:50S ribosome-binding GTPase [Phycisphaerales bacterium]
MVAALLREPPERAGTDPSARATEARLARSAALCLSHALLRMATGAAEPRPRQLAVLGPTQSGKSTVVNLLLGVEAARVSPLAGFTAHASGFLPPGMDHESWSGRLFPGCTRIPYAELSPLRLNAYSLDSVPRQVRESAGLNAVVWDTPDVDSVHASDYLGGVIEAAALADAYAVVVSKEKYADRSVWRLLSLLGALDRPLLICVNKLPPSDSGAILESLQARMRAAGGCVAGAAVVAIEHFAEPPTPQSSPRLVERLQRAAGALLQSAAAPGPRPGADGALRLLARGWANWTAQARSRHAAIRDWAGRVESAARSIEAGYVRDYLNDDRRFDALRRTTIELLTLLEIPWVAGPLRQVRRVVTWPLREGWRALRASMNRPQADPARGGQGVLAAEIEAQLTRLELEASRAAGDVGPAAGAWHDIARALRADRPALARALSDAAADCEERCAAEIRSAAAELYAALQRSPALLNSLRAARATADAAGLALAIKTGGAALSDVIFAPALLAVTTLLTEGALGSYMSTLRQRLHRAHVERLRTDVLSGVWNPLLSALGARAEHALPAETLQRADAALREWADRSGVPIAPPGGSTDDSAAGWRGDDE